MPLEFTTVSQLAKVHGVKMIIYGLSGMGKTMLAATAPNPIVASAEAGLLSLSLENQKRVFGVAVDIDVTQIKTLDDLIEFYDLMIRPDNPYDTIFLDSASEIGEKVLNNALAQVKDPRQAYGELQDKMIAVFKQFRDIPNKHVVFLCKQMGNHEGNTPLNVIAMPGKKLSGALPYLFDEVFHLDVGETAEKVKYRFLQTQPDLQFDAKDRSGALDPIEEPNLTAIINKIVRK